MNFRKAVVPNLLAGTLGALMTLAYASGFASLIFGGQFEAYTGQAVLVGLVASCVTLLILSVGSSFNFAVGGPDSNPSAILAITVAAMAAEMALAGSSTAQMLPTVLMYLFLSAIGCGAVLYLVGARRWGRYVRYIPHQVVGGFLAGTGYLLLTGGWRMLTGHTPWQTGWEQIQSVPVLAWWTAGLVAFGLTVLLRFRTHYLIIPGVIFFAVAIFHLFLFFQGMSVPEARAAGLLLGPLPVSSWAAPFSISWQEVRWDLLLFHLKDFAAMSMVVIITILLNATSLEVATGTDPDFDRELKTLGAANVLTGLFGGMVAVNSFNRSLLNWRAGGDSRWSARFCAVLVLGIGVFFPGIVGLLPRPVLTGLILYLGISLLLTWLWDKRHETPLVDYLVIVAMLVIVAFAGIVPGVLLGVIISSLSFVITFSRSSSIKVRFNGSNRRSNVERLHSESDWLRQEGQHLQGFVLHGYLFFGTSTGVLDQIREVFGEAKVVLIDFWDVSGVDASSAVVFRKIIRLCESHDIQTIFTGLSRPLQAKLERCGLDLSRHAVRLFPDLDYGLEWSEQILLAETPAQLTLPEALGLSSPFPKELESYFESVNIPAGETFIRRGDEPDAFYIVLRGRVSISLSIAGTDYTKRLRAYGPGTIVGEMGFFSQEVRSADIRTDVDSVLSRMTQAKLERLESEEPVLAGQICRLVIRTLSSRLRTANEEISHLL